MGFNSAFKGLIKKSSYWEGTVQIYIKKKNEVTYWHVYLWPSCEHCNGHLQVLHLAEQVPYGSPYAAVPNSSQDAVLPAPGVVLAQQGHPVPLPT